MSSPLEPWNLQTRTKNKTDNIQLQSNGAEVPQHAKIGLCVYSEHVDSSMMPFCNRGYLQNDIE